MIVIMIGLMIVIMIVIMIGIMIVRAHDSSVTPSTTGCFDRAPTRSRAIARRRHRATTDARVDERSFARAIAIAERRKGDRRRRRCRRGAGRRRARRMAWLANTQRAEDRAGRGRRRSVECSGRSRGRSWRRWR